jgi:signal transduction histidine kinase
VEEITSLSFAHDQNNLNFSFAVTDYRAPETNKYFTRLEGYDSAWHEAGAEKTAYFYNVPPGDYIFLIKAFDSDGLQLQKTIAVHISPPWWKTWWAYLLYLAIFLTAVLIAFRVLKQRIIERERQKSQEFELAQAKEIEKAYKELKSTQAQLIQAEKMASLGELTAGIAHEIQNPLNFVNNFAEINSELIEEAEEAIDKGDRAEAKLILSDLKDNEKKIRHHGQRADAIVKNMLQHSRSNAGQKEPTDINALADEYFRLAYHGLRAKDKSFNATLNTDFDKNIGKINIIPQDIGRVLLNLYNNAFYAVSAKASAYAKDLADRSATADAAQAKSSAIETETLATTDAVNKKKTVAGETYEPTVTVSTKLFSAFADPLISKSTNSIIISVKDNGNGIPEKVVEKVFQPFFTTKPTGQGTGLGLSLSYDIIKAHGGEISIKNNPGEGAEFIITLPIDL